MDDRSCAARSMPQAAAEPQAADRAAAEDLARYARFAADLTALRAAIVPQIGAVDLRRVRRLERCSRACEAAGRALLHFGRDPVTFVLGVGLLWVRKQLHAMEIGHTVLHGAYDNIDQSGGGKVFAARSFRWDTAIDEASWRYGHNVRHHGGTNIAGADGDIHFSAFRLTYDTPYHRQHRSQLYRLIGLAMPGFTFWMGLHFSGLLAWIFIRWGRPAHLDLYPDRTWAGCKRSLQRAMRKFVPYYLKNYTLFPLLPGALFWRVFLGNLLADVLTNLYASAIILCGHNGAAAQTFRAGTTARSYGEWCAMQVAATNNLTLRPLLSLLAGGLDLQIEHHLFPTLPPQRLRQIAPQVREICARHGIAYRSYPWGTALINTFKHVHELSYFGGEREVHPPVFAQGNQCLPAAAEPG